MASKGIGNLDFDSISIGNLIRDHHHVPKNQREYAWETRNIEHILQDITTAKDSDQGEYFLGTIVLVREGDKLSVVDGQQRIATVYIIISAIRNYLDQTNDSENIKRARALESKYLFNTDITTLETEPFFTLNETDNELFHSAILDPSGNFQKMDKSKPSHILLKNAYEIIYNYISRIAEAPPNHVVLQLMEIVDYLESYVRVLVVTANDESKAFILFETLNDRGLDLAVSDLLKNYLLGKAGKKIDAVKKSWSSMQSALEALDSGDKITLYIMHLWCSKYGVVREREIFSAIKNEIKTSQKAVEFAMHLEEGVKKYISILSASKSFWTEYDFKAWNAMQTINLLNQAQPRPLILSVLGKFSNNDVIKAMQAIEKMAVRLSISGHLGGATMEKFYSELALGVTTGSIASADDLITKTKSKLPTDEEFGSAFSKSSFSRAGLARYYLIELEKIKEGSDKVTNEDVKEINLEHILPKNFPDDGWEQFTEEEYKKYFKRLGNMALMNSKDNSSSDRDPFLKKVEYYKNSNIIITKDIEKYTVWNPETIQARQNELASLAIKRW